VSIFSPFEYSCTSPCPEEDTVQQNMMDNSSHEQDWDFYFSNVDDIIGSFYIDLGLAVIAPIQGKLWLVWISVKMKNPREDGLSSQEEFGVLIEIEDKLEEYLTGRHDSIYVGRLTTNGRRDLYFYLNKTEFHAKTISEAMVAFPSYSFDFGVKEDSQWDYYFNFMYPNPRQFQSIQNRRVIENLEKNGDPLTKSRPVDHWIYFKTDNDRNNFLSRIEHLGFKVVSKDDTMSSDDYPYTLQISRIDNVDHNSVDDYVLALWELAAECNGDYDGWETSIEKE
jgi:uncharacterized protein (TIGR01619 family)